MIPLSWDIYGRTKRSTNDSLIGLRPRTSNSVVMSATSPSSRRMSRSENLVEEEGPHGQPFLRSAGPAM